MRINGIKKREMQIGKHPAPQHMHCRLWSIPVISYILVCNADACRDILKNIVSELGRNIYHRNRTKLQAQVSPRKESFFKRLLKTAAICQAGFLLCVEPLKGPTHHGRQQAKVY